MTDSFLTHPSMGSHSHKGGSAEGHAFQLELAVGVLRGARAMATACDDLRNAENAADAAEAQERLDLIIDQTIATIKLYDGLAIDMLEHS